MLKLCTRCGVEKPIESFGSRGRTPCLECMRRKRAEYYAKNKKVLYERRRLTRRRSALVEQSARLRHLYGISLLERQMLIKKQGGRCALCPRLFVGRAVPCVDHDRKMNGPKRDRVRGILCHACNLALGIAESIGDLDRHPRLRRYVESPPAWKWLKTNTHRED